VAAHFLPGLRSQEPLGSRPVTLALSVISEGILDCDGLIHEELVHGLDGHIGGFEVGIGHEPITL